MVPVPRATVYTSPGIRQTQPDKSPRPFFHTNLPFPLSFLPLPILPWKNSLFFPSLHPYWNLTLPHATTPLFFRILHFHSFFVYFLWRARVCWPLLCLCRPFCTFERYLDSNPECCRVKHAGALPTKPPISLQLSHPSPSDLATHLPNNLATHLPPT